MVPIASKKLVSTRVKTSSVVATTPMCVNAPKRLTLPTIDRSGSPPSEFGISGTAMPQPPVSSAADPVP